jgi:hypothetical protein
VNWNVSVLDDHTVAAEGAIRSDFEKRGDVLKAAAFNPIFLNSITETITFHSLQTCFDSFFDSFFETESSDLKETRNPPFLSDVNILLL